MKNEPFLGSQLIFTTSDYLERNFCNKSLIFFIMDLPTDIKFIKLNLLIHFRGSITFEVQSYKVRSLSKFCHSKFGPFRGWVLFEVGSFSRLGPFQDSVIRGSVTFEVQSFEVQSFSRFSLSRFGLLTFSLSKLGLSRFGLSTFGLSTFGLSTFSLSTFGHGFGKWSGGVTRKKNDRE